MKKNELANNKYNVVKSNTLIQKSRYNLSLQEQKIILRLIQMIKPSDKEFTEYTFVIKEFCEFCNIELNGKNYKDIKDSLLKLSSEKWWLNKDDNFTVTVGWISKVIINHDKGSVSIQLDPDLKPYLLDLQDYFTQYNLYYTLTMRSKYAIRLYELLKSYQNLKEKTFDIESLKHQLMADTYTNWTDFKRKVIDLAIKEINLLTDIQVSYEAIKIGRSFQEIIFTIKPKKDVSDKLKTWDAIENRLDKKQMKDQFKLAISEIIPLDKYI